MTTGTQKLGALVWFGSIVTITAVGIAIFASWLLYNQTINLLTENLRQRLLSISVTQAANIDGEALEALQVEADWIKPEWSKVVTQLKKAKDANENIVFMYIFRKVKNDQTKMEFVADAESIYPYANTDNDSTNDIDVNSDGVTDAEGADKLQWPGQPYPEASDIVETYEAYNGPLTAAELYEDSYGEVLTGYAPIYDEEGNVVAILATDIKAGDFFTVTQQTLYPFLIFIVCLTLIIAVLAITLIYSWKHRTEILAKLSAELEQSNKQQEGLLHFISHEIKGYLTDGQNAFAAIVEGDVGKVTPQVLELSQTALGKMRQGVRTVLEILDASNMKMGTVAYKKEQFDFRVVAEDAVEHMRARAAEKKLTLDLSVDTTKTYQISGDKDRLAQHVVRNLIDNSIRYTPQGSIHVTLARTEKMLRFSVKDTGVGITPEDKPKLFTEGGHGKDSIKVNVDSTGYGLYIAKQVVEAHGGTIHAESAGAGKGSEFIVELPV